MELYGLIVTHLWLISLVVIYIGYLTCADYYDKFSIKFIRNYKLMSIAASASVLMFFVISLPEIRKFPIWNVYVGLSCICSWILSICSILLFFHHSDDIRQYFGNKRGKI